MSEEKGFWDKQAEGLNNMWREISKTFTGKDPAVSTFSVYDSNNEEQEQNLSEQGKIYKTPTGYTSHRGYAYLDMGEDGRLKLNVSKSVAESDWFKTQFTENDNFNKIIRMFNGNPGANTTISSTDKDGNIKNMTLADAVSQYNKALGEYAEKYEGMSALRDFYNENTGLNLTDEQLMISESSINKDDDKNSDSKVIYIPDSWNAIYNFSKLKSWDPKTKTVSAKDFFDVYNLDESGSINEEQWNRLREAAEAEVTNAFSGSVSHNLNKEDADAVKYAGDKLAKAVAALNTINGSRPDVNFAHGTAIFLSSVGEEFTTVVAKTVGNLGDVAQAFLDACETSEIPVISQVAGAAEGVVDIAATAVTAPIIFIGELAGDLTDGTLSLDHAGQYLTNISNAIGDIWSDNESKKKFSDYKILAGNSINDLTGALDKDISYMQTISGAATAGKVVGGALGMAFEVWLTEVTGKGAGQLITTSWTALGRGLGLISKTADTAKKVSALTKIYKGVGAVASYGVNMAVQGFMDTIETEPGQFLAQAMRDGNISEEEKQELLGAISSNTMFNIIASGVTEKLIPGFLETKPGRFIQARAQKVASAVSLPIKGTEIGLAKLLNNIGAGKKVSESLKEAMDKEVMKFGAYSVNDYYTKLAMADYDATKLVVKAKAGNTYIDSLTGKTIKAKTTTEAVEIAVKNRVRLQNMIDRVTKGVDAERKEILSDPNVSTTYKDLNKKSTAVAEIEAREGRDAFKISIDGKSTRLMSQESSDYVAYKKNLDYMTRKKDILEAAGKTLSAADEAYLKGLEEKVLGFATTHSKELVSALDSYYGSNLAFNKALTDYELKNGLITQEMYDSLASTGFFGADDEFYMHTIAIKPKNGKFTEEYAEYEKAMASYEEGYARRSSGTYSVNPEHKTDQHIAKALDAHYLDPNMADFSRVTAMARTIQARNWGRSLSAIGQPFKEISVDGKATSMKQLTDASAEYKQAATKAVDRLDTDDLKNVAVGQAYTDQYDIEGRIERKEAAEAKALGIGSNEQMSKNVNNLSSDQIAEDIANIDGAPNYTTISRAEEYDAIYNNMSKEEKLIVDKKMASQTKGYENAYNEKAKAAEQERKALVKQADGLDKEAAKIDKEIARIEKRNASGQASYEKKKAAAEKKAKAAAEKKAKAAEEKAKKAAVSRAKYEESLAKDNEFYSGITDKRGRKMYNDLYNDLNDAAIDQFQFDVKDAQEIDMEDAISAVSEARSEEVSNVFKKGTKKKEFINRRRELANLVDNGKITKAEAQKKLIEEYVDPDYLNNARVKAFGDSAASQVTESKITKNNLEDLPFDLTKDDNAGILRSLNKEGKYTFYDGNEFKKGSLRDYYRFEKGVENEVVLMSPQDYINILKRSGQTSDDYVEYVIKGGDKLPKYVEAMKNGEKFPTPYLKFDKEGLSGQEGRHRAIAAMEAGYDKIPVAVSYPYKKDLESVLGKKVKVENITKQVSDMNTTLSEFVPESTAEKVAEAAAKREEAAALRGQAEGVKNPRKLSDKQQTIKAWNDSVKKTTMVNELNKQWLREELLKGEKGAISEEMLGQLRLQIANANYADKAFVKNLETGKLKETEWLKSFRERSDEIRELKGVLADMAKGEDELMSGALAISDMIVDNTIKDASENMLGKEILERAKAQGIDPDAVQEYMALDALLKQSPDGTMKLRGDVKEAVDKRMRKEFRKNIKAEGNLSEGAEGELIKMLQDTIEEDVINRWSKAQKALVDAGGNEFVDMEKNFAFVKKEMENFVGEFNSENVIMMLGEDGVPRYYEASPLLADLYMNRPVAQFSRVSEFFNKTSRLARLSSTNLNMKSVINQCFKDPINAFIGGGMMRSVKFNQKEMVELFGDNLVAQLEETMTKAGWDVFTEGGTIAGRELQEKAVKYVTEEAGVETFVEGTSSNVLYDTQRGAFKKVRDGAGAYINMQGYQNAYKRSKKSLLDWANRHSPGYWINETRENYLRKGDYVSAFRDALGQGKTLEEAKNIAEFVSRQATTNFGRMFSWGNSIVNAVPFLGAALNGSTSFWRLYMIDPVGVTMRFTTAGIAMMSIVAQSMTSKRDRDVYKTIPEYVKADNLAFVYDGEVFKIPIPEELAGLLAPFRQAVEKSWAGIENHNWFEILVNDLLDVSPIDLDGFKTLGEINLDSDPTIFDRMSREAMVLVSQLSPTILKSAIMGFTGIDPYTGNPIDKSYTTFDEDGNQIIMDNNQTAIGNWLSSTLGKYGIKRSSSFWTKVVETMAGTGFFTLGKAVENALGSGPDAGAQVLAENIAGATTVPSYQLEDPYLREFKATIKQLEDEKNALLAADGDLSEISQQISRLDKSADNYEEKKKKLMQQWMQKTEDYRKKVLNTVTKYNNHYGSTYTANQFASVWNLLMFDNQTLIPQDAYQSQQLSQMYYTARQQAYQTMIDMGFDSPNDWSIFGVARRNAQTGEIYIKYSSPTAILNMSSVAMGAGNVYAAELEATLKNAGLDKSTRYKLMTEAQSKGKKAVKEFKKAWNAQVALTIADVMNKYGASNVIESGDATSLLNEYLYVSNSGYKVRDYLEAVYGMED